MSSVAAPPRSAQVAALIRPDRLQAGAEIHQRTLGHIAELRAKVDDAVRDDPAQMQAVDQAAQQAPSRARKVWNGVKKAAKVSGSVALWAVQKLADPVVMRDVLAVTSTTAEAMKVASPKGRIAGAANAIEGAGKSVATFSEQLRAPPTATGGAPK